MIRFDTPVDLKDGIDTEEYEALRKLLLKKRVASDTWIETIQIDGYGEHLHPKPGFEDRFEATVRALKDYFIEHGNYYLYGHFSESDPYCQPSTCWNIAIYDYTDMPGREYDHLKRDFYPDRMTPAITARYEKLGRQISERK